MGTVNIPATFSPSTIQLAIDHSAVGDLIQFSKDTFLNLPQITLRAGRTYDGGGANVTANGGQYCFQVDPAAPDNITIRGFNFSGRAIRIASNSGWTNHLAVTANTFTGTAVGPEPQAIGFWGLRNSSITNNVMSFRSPNGVVNGFGFDNLIITGNDVHDFLEGFHILGNYNFPSLMITLSGNRFQRSGQMCIELQGALDHVICEDNVVLDSVIVPNFHSNDTTFGISLACDGAMQVECRRNYIDCEERADGTGLREGIEIAAHPNATLVVAEQNWMKTTNAGITSHSPHAVIQNNHLDCPRPLELDALPTLSVNNTPTTAVNWDTTRAWPIGSVPVVVPPPVVVAPAPIALGTLVKLSATQAQAVWADKSTSLITLQ